MIRSTLLLLVLAASQTQTQASEFAQIYVPEDQREAPIRLQAVDVDVNVQAAIASSRIELEFANPNDRVLEGEFVFPLTATQTVVGYALEVNGVMREAVVVPKATARIAFEETTRRQIDPGLAELTRGNVFRTRIYPIPAKGSKRIAIYIEQTLVDQHFKLALPIQNQLDRYHLRIAVAEKPLQSSGRLQFNAAKVAESTERNVVPAAIDLQLPSSDKDHWIEAIATRQDTRNGVSDGPPLLLAQLSAPAFKSELRAPKDITIYFDASRSATKLDQAANRQFIATLLQGRDVDVQLIRFHHRLEIAQHFAIVDGDSRALLKAMQDTAFDGGTNLSALQSTRATDLAIVLSDGDSSFEPYQVEPNTIKSELAKQTIIVAATATPSPIGLRALAERFNGKIITLAGKIDFEKAVRDALQPQLLLTATSSSCSGDPAIAWPSTHQARLAWRCPLGTSINLRWRIADQVQTQTLVMPAAVSVAGVFAPPLQRAWAKVRIEQLQSNAKARAEQLSLALQYELVTEQTSLLVLDSVDDYLRYNIRPKEAVLRAEFDARRAAIGDQADRKQSLNESLDNLRTQWKALAQWHQRAHPWLEGVLQSYAEQNLDLTTSLDTSARNLARKQLSMAISALDEKPGTAREQRMKQVFLAMQQQREQWIAKLPEAERAEFNKARNHLDVSSLRRNGAVVARDSSPPPPSPMASQSEPAPTEPVMEMEADQAMEEVVVTGSAMRAAEISAEKPKLDVDNTQATIALKAYDANAPYLDRIRSAKDPYQGYLLESQSESSVGFYLDSAEYFARDLKQADLALRILSNIAELQIEDIGATRVLAETLRQWQHWDFALQQFALAQAMRSEEPQGYRDLAMSLAAAPINQGGDPVRAVEFLWQVVSHDWDERFNGITLASLHELNDIYMRLSNADKNKLRALEIPADLLQPVPVGLRVVLGWNANDVDIDLWVRDPAGEWAYYSQPQTRTGGQMSDDFTAGYGPETFTIARPLPGKYTVFAHYFANHKQKLLAPVSVYLEFQTPFDGSVTSKKASIVRRLETNESGSNVLPRQNKEQIEIGEFVIE